MRLEPRLPILLLPKLKVNLFAPCLLLEETQLAPPILSPLGNRHDTRRQRNLAVLVVQLLALVRRRLGILSFTQQPPGPRQPKRAKSSQCSQRDNVANVANSAARVRMREHSPHPEVRSVPGSSSPSPQSWSRAVWHP